MTSVFRQFEILNKTLGKAEKQTIGENKPKFAKSWVKGMLKDVWLRGLTLHTWNKQGFLTLNV